MPWSFVAFAHFTAPEHHLVVRPRARPGANHRASPTSPARSPAASGTSTSKPPTEHNKSRGSSVYSGDGNDVCLIQSALQSRSPGFPAAARSLPMRSLAGAVWKFDLLLANFWRKVVLSPLSSPHFHHSLHLHACHRFPRKSPSTAGNDVAVLHSSPSRVEHSRHRPTKYPRHGQVKLMAFARRHTRTFLALSQI